MVEQDGERVAAIVYDASLAEERKLLDAVVAAAGIALKNERLAAELRARVNELSASRARIVGAGDEERRRLERNLHDGAQQRLVALGMQLRLLGPRIRTDPAAAEALVATAATELATSVDELRELAHGIHPAVLDHGLASRSSRSPRARPSPRLCRSICSSDSPRCRGRRLLRRLGGARERREARAGDGGGYHRLARRDRARWWRSQTTASAEPTTPADRGCAALPTASRRWAVSFGSGARAAAGTTIRR